MSVFGYVFSVMFLLAGIIYTELDWSWMAGRPPSQLDLYALSIWLLLMSVSWDIWKWREHEQS